MRSGDLLAVTHLAGNAALGGGHVERAVEDGCQAFGSATKNGAVGEMSDLCVFSFHAAKIVSSVEGGCVVTSSDAVCERLRTMRGCGLTERGAYDFRAPAMNARMTDVQAAIGRRQLDSAEVAIRWREFLAGTYEHFLDDLVECGKIELFSAPDHMTRRVRSTFPIAVDRPAELAGYLSRNGVEVRRFFPPVTEPLRSAGALDSRACPVAGKLYERVLLLPIGNATTVDDVCIVCAKMHQYFSNEERGKPWERESSLRAAPDS